MPHGDAHREAAKRPWDREEAYRVSSTRLGRPDLPAVEQELEGLVRLIGTLPKRNPWWPGQGNVLEVAYEVRALLAPRIATVTLGRGDLFAEYWMFGPGPSDLRCATLCLALPKEEAWDVPSDRRWLLSGERARSNLSRSVLRSAAEAIRDEISRHWVVAPELTGR